MMKKYTSYLFLLAMSSSQLSAYADTDSKIKAVNKGLKENISYHFVDFEDIKTRGVGGTEPCKRCGGKICVCSFWP